MQQALYSTFAASDSLAPAAIAGAVSAALFTASRLGRIPDALKPLMRNLLGWTATLLFMFQPLAQLVSPLSAPAVLIVTLLISYCTTVAVSVHRIRQVSIPLAVKHIAAASLLEVSRCITQRHPHSMGCSRCTVPDVQMNNFAVPTSLEGLSLGTILLALVGNGLMVPRALFTRDSIWLLGSAWGSAFGWLQLLSMFVGRSASGCAPDPTGRVTAAGGHRSVLHEFFPRVCNAIRNKGS